MISFYRHNEGVKTDYVIELLESGKNLALVSDAGTPGISDPGEDLVKEAIEHNINVVPVPGAVAFIQGLIASGFDTTRFVFEGFLSINKRARRERLEYLKRETRTMIFYEAPHKLKRTIQDLYDAFGGERKIVLARELTKIHETVMRTSLKGAIDYFEVENPRGEYVLIIAGAEKQKEKQPVTLEQAVEIAKELVNKGMSVNDASKAVAADTGIKKSVIYKELL